jgi:hypothetical protein
MGSTTVKVDLLLNDEKKNEKKSFGFAFLSGGMPWQGPDDVL